MSKMERIDDDDGPMEEVEPENPPAKISDEEGEAEVVLLHTETAYTSRIVLASASIFTRQPDRPSG